MGYLNISIQHWVIIFDVMIMPVVVMITIITFFLHMIQHRTLHVVIRP